MEKDGFFNNKDNGIGIPQGWNSIFGMELESQGSELHCSSEQQYPSCYINSNWDNSMDQSDPFESALSSIVSSPGNSHSGILNSGVVSGGENVVLKELIGRLGIICNSGEVSVSPTSCIVGNNSTNTSCYNTPLNSPPKLNLSTMDHGNSIPGNHQFPPAQFPADPGFVERAARLSCFGMKEPEFPHMMESGKLSRVSSNQSFKTTELPIPIPASDKKQLSRLSLVPDNNNKELDSLMEESSLSEHNPNLETGIKGNGRKRKVIPKGKGIGIETHSSTLSAKDSKTVEEPEKEVTDAKRSKSGEEGNGIEKEKENAKTEPPKDYIHVRARRGQATDSHSLAERVRREKISERMKFLQDLVPGCNKVTGKALMLDEIINYVQSLQRQVEFLSMKLATINSRTDMNMEAVLSKDTRASMLNTMNQVDALAQPFYVMAHNGPQNPLTSMLHRGSNMRSSQIGGFGEASTLWANDLQSVVHNAFSQNRGPTFHGTMGTGQMKVEL